jgi:predicted metal-dependent HD superfamily phosphohydrolase
MANLNKYGFAQIGISDDLGIEWLTKMTEKHRYYHTVTHVQDIILGSRAFCVDGSEASFYMIAAAWLHDIIYDPKSSTNEEDSAEYALECLKGSLVDPDRVARIILSTKTHFECEDELSQMFCDLDMAILAEPAPIYDDYARKIRLEYAHVPEGIYCAKRADILEEFDKEQIFKTPVYYHLEDAAHANLRREIINLKERA